MNTPGQGLTATCTEDLVEILRLIHSGRLPCPIKTTELLSMGLNRVAYQGAILVGLDAKAATAVLTAVIAERRK